MRHQLISAVSIVLAMHVITLCLCVGVLQDEIQELELPTDSNEKILIKLAELKHVSIMFPTFSYDILKIL